MRFFFYGTLRDSAVREAVLGKVRAGKLDIAPATLPGWRCVHIRGRLYPVIVPDANGEVPGLLARGVDREGYRRLSAFESDEYVEKSVDVITADGRHVEALAYSAGPRACPAATPWDFDLWVRHHRAAFLRRIAGTAF